MTHYLKEAVDTVYTTPENIVEFISKENMKTFKKFWMVFLPSKNAPTRMYFSELEAETEAKRLAVKESTEAVVLASESVFKLKKNCIMKPAKEKAKELFDKFTVVGLQQRNEGIACALICVDEILSLFINECEDTRYWQEVKSEIEKL